MVSKKKKRDNKFSKHWDYYLILAFILIRLFLNLDFIFNFNSLFLLFAIVYFIFFLMLTRHVGGFATLFVMFLSIDSVIGTYLFTMAGNLGAEFYGTIVVNLVAIYLVVKNSTGSFKR